MAAVHLGHTLWAQKEEEEEDPSHPVYYHLHLTIRG